LALQTRMGTWGRSVGWWNLRPRETASLVTPAAADRRLNLTPGPRFRCSAKVPSRGAAHSKFLQDTSTSSRSRNVRGLLLCDANAFHRIQAPIGQDSSSAFRRLPPTSADTFGQLPAKVVRYLSRSRRLFEANVRRAAGREEFYAGLTATIDGAPSTPRGSCAAAAKASRSTSDDHTAHDSIWSRRRSPPTAEESLATSGGGLRRHPSASGSAGTKKPGPSTGWCEIRCPSSGHR